jgi:hypothetical protein
MIVNEGLLGGEGQAGRGMGEKSLKWGLNMIEV